MNKCDKSENQLFDSMIRFIKKQIIAIENSQNDKESTVDLMNGI